MMATFHRDGADLKVAVKGAAEAVIERSTTVSGTGGKRPLDEDEKERWTRSNAALAELGLRVLAVAAKTVADADADPYKDLSLVGLCALLDPPRRDAAAAMDACRGAGIRVVMVTGDQAPTAAYIARAVRMTTDDEARVVAGHEIPDSDALTDDQRERLRETAIFARVDPEQKLDLIALHQEAGEVVAMTGDGVNDAPALKKADIGIAMGQRGTPVAQEAADMVLTDDSFSSIVAAVHQGRVILGNIRKFVVYLMSCNVSEVFVVTGAVVVDAPLPILPLQILFLNLVTDVFPALALALGEGDEGLMALPPRDPAEPILRRDHWLRIIGYGLVITAAVLGAFAVAIFWLGYGPRRAVTVSFATLAMAQLWHVFNLREPGSSLLRNDIVRNPWVWGALALCVGLVAAAVHLPGLSTVLRTENPGLVGWLVILGMSLVPLALGQVSKSFQGRFYSETHPPSTSIFGER